MMTEWFSQSLQPFGLVNNVPARTLRKEKDLLILEQNSYSERENVELI